MIIIKSTRRKGRIFEVGRMSLQWLALASLIRTKKKIEKGTLLSNILVFTIIIIIIIIIITFYWYLLMCRLNSTSANYNASKKHKNSTKQYKDIKQKH
jgi:heme/copper-type cytochrome/quinol oxidase subunit 2